MDERPRDDTQQQPAPWGGAPTPAAPKGTRRTKRVGLIVIAVAVVAIAAAVTHRPAKASGAADTAGTDSSAVSQFTDTAPGAAPTLDTSSPDTNQGDPLAVGAPATSQAPAIPAQVTYSCKGTAPDGVDITYGPDGSNHSASSLPFTHTDSLDTTAQYYVTTAQLQGSGNVSCTTIVQTDNGDGTAHQVTKDASADGGYNIASAEVCSTFDGGWEAC
jgi:hypothetical protein